MTDRNSSVFWVGEVEVNYSVRPTYTELCGIWFDWAHERFSETIHELRELPGVKPPPVSGIIKRDFGYVHLGYDATDQEALVGIAVHHVIPVTDLELMYFGKTFSAEQCKFPIPALRSLIRIGHDLATPVLREHNGKRNLGLYCDTGGYPWHYDHRFLVRKDD